MSEFDEEAERERLREQYEQDQADRESTQRMSELLLKGATMTNAHCGTCGDPIFRQNGEEFCPTCQEAVDVDGEAGADAGPSQAADRSSADGSTADRSQTADGSSDRDLLVPEHDASEDRSPSEEAGAGRAADAPADRSSTRAPDRSSTPGRDASASAPTGSAGAGDAIADSRAAIETTLERFATAAAETSDPRQARDHLAAAREAAEALAALDRL